MAIDRSFSLAAAALYQELAPCAAQAVPGGELLLNSTTVLTDEKTLLVAVLYLPVLQFMAFHRSLAKGLDPDRPANLTAVVKLNL